MKENDIGSKNPCHEQSILQFCTRSHRVNKELLRQPQQPYKGFLSLL